MNSKAVQKLTYPIALILSTTGKKTGESLAKVVNKSGDTMLRLLEHNCVTFEDLLSFACEFFANDDLHLIIDDTLISKMYSEVIEGTSDNYDSSNNRTYRSLCSITAMLTNGKYALPLDTKMWISREIAQDQYKTKLELAQELILCVKCAVAIKSVIMDGLYCHEPMIKWLNDHGLSFEMRFHSNRTISYKEEKSVPVRDCKYLRLNGRHNTRTIAAYWKGIPLYITAVKRECKTGKYITTYQVSNYRMQARQHKRIYGYR